MDNNYNNNYSSQYENQPAGTSQPPQQNVYTAQGAYTSQNSYGAQNAQHYNGYNPYQQPAGMSQTPKPPKQRKKGFGVTLAKCAAIALVFGMVAGAVFTGVSYAGTRVLGITADAGEQSEGGSSFSTADPDSAVKPTATGYAAELTDVSAIVEEALPSIVAITNIGTVTYQTFWGEQEYESQSCGSGIIISQDKDYLYIVTNNHVVGGADTLTVQFADGGTASCEIQGIDPSDDLAVVKVAMDSIEADTLGNIKVATIGDSEALKMGEGAISIGNALGYGQSTSVGHISALGRTVTVQDPTTGNTIVNQNMIQTDAAINPGNSGGALLNSKGEVIGINSVKYSDTDVEGFGFAIPMADAMPIVEQLIKNGEVEEPQSAYLAIQGQDVSSDMTARYNMPVGVYVYQVIPGSAAEQAGIRQGDIITKFDSQQVSTMQELKSLLAAYEAGQTVTVELQRLDDNGYEKQEISVTLGTQNGTAGQRR